MFYRTLLIITLTFTLNYADNFKRVNPRPNDTMLKNQKNAQVCSKPIEANEELTEDFKYGCFCGKEYPKIEDNSTKEFRELTKEKRVKLIEKFYSIKPYDDIDAICMQHDICYLYQGKKAKVCNNAIYDELYEIAEAFNDANKTIENEQCRNLSVDMASVFKTFFAMADDEDTIFDFGISMITTGITVANKTLQESVDTFSDEEDRYPKNGHKCLIEK